VVAAPVLGQAFAPGKVIVLGEHAAVYGHPAVAAGLQRGVTVKVVPDENGPRLRAGHWGVDLPLTEGEGAAPLSQALERVRVMVAPQLTRFCLEADDQLVLGAGLGSSAALTVACARALAAATGVTLDQDRLTQVVHRAEQVFHGNPSGVDQAAVVHGGVIRFQRPPGGVATVRKLVLKKPLPLVVALLRPHVGTREAVEGLRLRRERHRRTFDLLLSELGALAQDAVEDVENADFVTLGQRMDLAHGMLDALGVGSEDLDDLVRLGRRHGALGAKLTGAGVGGAVVMVTNGDPDVMRRLVATLQDHKAQAFGCDVT
jgi:mevalonate kinase